LADVVGGSVGYFVEGTAVDQIDAELDGLVVLLLAASGAVRLLRYPGLSCNRSRGLVRDSWPWCSGWPGSETLRYPLRLAAMAVAADSFATYALAAGLVVTGCGAAPQPSPSSPAHIDKPA
jgi:hypothetical protein